MNLVVLQTLRWWRLSRCDNLCLRSRHLCAHNQPAMPA